MTAALDTRAMLERTGIAAIANALLKRGLRNVVLRGVQPVSPDQPAMVGPAFTLRFIPAREDIDTIANYGKPGNKHRRAIEEIPAGAVLVIDARGDTSVSTAGDMMAMRMFARGAKGLVTDGGLRDVPGIRSSGLPAFHQAPATAATPIALHPIELDGPIGCGGVAIYPGDMMVGDASGVVAIPAHLVDEVAREAYEATLYEAFAEREIRRGRSMLEVFPATESSLEEYRAWVAAGRPA